LHTDPLQHFKKSLDPGHEPAPDRVLECRILQINTSLTEREILCNLSLSKTVEELLFFFLAKIKKYKKGILRMFLLALKAAFCK
jgi:hypothetical protein